MEEFSESFADFGAFPLKRFFIGWGFYGEGFFIRGGCLREVI